MHLDSVARWRSRMAALTAITITSTATVTGCGSSNNDNAAATKTTMTPGQMSGHSSHDSTMSMSGHASAASMAAMTPLAAHADGLRASAGGLTLTPSTMTLPATEATRWTFRITDKSGMAVKRFERDQTKLLHLIVARGDLTAYQHLHPVLDATSGQFTITITLPSPGAYRAIADFTTDGKRHVLGVALRAPGPYNKQSLPAAAPTFSTDGYQVRLKDTKLIAGKEATTVFSITHAARPVSDLQPYLGAYGHLVALREGDLAYSHVHPVAHDQARGTVTFAVDLATAATYRLFLQFRNAETVHTAAFTVRATG